MNFLAIFLEFSIPSRVGTRRNFFFFFSLFHCSSQPNLVRKDAMIVFSDFLNFFAIFFGIFYYRSSINTSEWFFFPLFLYLSQPILAWKEAMMVFSNFLNFFAIFLEFCIMGQVGTHRNDFFYFLFFSAFQNLFWPEMKLWWCFVIFWIFLLFFWNFLFRVE